MNIFTDFHHSGLLYALKLLLEDRLGHNLFRPVGMDWFPEWWDIAKPYNNDINTAKQYLQLKPEYIPTDGTPPLNKILSKLPRDYRVEEQAHCYVQKCITLQQFIDMDIDVIIASIPDHALTYKRLRDKYKPKAKLVFQMGNMFNEVNELIRDGIIKNLLASTIKFPVSCHSVFYHQELNLDVFHPRAMPIGERINSFVIGLPDEKVFFEYKKLLPEYTFTAYASKYTPFIQTIRELADKIAESDWIFHNKPRGDGFGHLLYSTAFIGRPLIINFSDYSDKLGGELLIDGITAIDIGIRTPSQNVELIRNSNPVQMGLNLSKRVRELVDYEKEAQKVKSFLSDLKD